MINLLNNCCQNQQPLEIIYLDGAGRLSKRIIFVKRIDGKQIKAYCTLRQGQRTFHLEGILATQKVTWFQPPA